MSSTKPTQPRTRDHVLVITAVAGVVIAAIALVAEFGQWLYPRSPVDATPAASAVSVASKPDQTVASAPVAAESSTPNTSPKASPTLPTPRTPSAEYATASLQPYSKRGKLETTSTLLGLQPDAVAKLSDQSIPFHLGWTASTNCSTLPQDPESFQVDVQVAHPTDIYVLIQAGNAAKSYEGREVGKVHAVFSDGREFVTMLILGRNIRDWARTSSRVVSTISGDDVQSVWEGQTAQGTAGGIDMLTIRIPADYQSLTLTGIKIEDTSVVTVGSSDPCIHIPAITVRYLE